MSHKSTSIPQAALLLSSTSQLERSDAIFNAGGMMSDLEGALHALLELHYSVDILAEHQLQPRLKEFPLVVVPDAHKLTDDFRSALLACVQDGGNLLLLGEKCARLFDPHLGVKLDGKPDQRAPELGTPSGPFCAPGLWQNVTPTTAKAVGYWYPDRDTRKAGQVAATIATLGKGRIGTVYGPTPTLFLKSHHPWLRQFVGAIVSELFPAPAVTTDAPPQVDLALRRTRDSKLSLHLLNRCNMQVAESYSVADFIPPLGPINVTIKVSARPTAVRWVPDAQELKWSWSDEVLSVTVPRLKVHGVILVD